MFFFDLLKKVLLNIRTFLILKKAGLIVNNFSEEYRLIDYTKKVMEVHINKKNVELEKNDALQLTEEK